APEGTSSRAAPPLTPPVARLFALNHAGASRAATDPPRRSGRRTAGGVPAPRSVRPCRAREGSASTEGWLGRVRAVSACLALPWGHGYEVERGGGNPAQLAGRAHVVAIRPVFDDLAVGDAQPVGLGDAAGFAGRWKRLLDVSVFVVEGERSDLASTGGGVNGDEVCV